MNLFRIIQKISMNKACFISKKMVGFLYYFYKIVIVYFIFKLCLEKDLNFLCCCRKASINFDLPFTTKKKLRKQGLYQVFRQSKSIYRQILSQIFSYISFSCLNSQILFLKFDYTFFSENRCQKCFIL